MEEQFYTILTEIGKAKIANATVLGEKLNLTKFQIGDSNGQYYNPTESQTSLKNKVWESNITSISTDPNNPSWVIIEVMIPADVGGFKIREAGVTDDKGNMIAIAKLPETYKPVADNGSTKDIIVKMILEVSNADSVIIKIDPSTMIASKKDVQIVEAKFKSTVGELSNLKTKDKSNIVNAINEVATDLNNIELTGNKVTIEDTDNNFTSPYVEGALKELANEDKALDTRVRSLETEVNGQRLRAIDVLNSIESKL